MNTKKTTFGSGTHAASFRISEEQYQEFQELLESVPGSDVGNMYREIFSRGLESVKTFYEKRLSLTREEVAGEMEEEP
jgi:hypothetical protein